MDSPVYRLPDNLPLLWTSANSIQIGVDPPRAYVDNIPDNATPLLHALTRGTPASGLAMLARIHKVSKEWLDYLMASLQPALTNQPPPRSLHLEAWATSPAIRDLVALASRCDMEVVIPDTINNDMIPGGDVVLVVADYIVHPQWADKLSRENVPHCPVVFSDQTVTVGPVVTPGETPCLVCLESRRRDQTRGWLEVSSQLWGKKSPLSTGRHIGMAWALLLLMLNPGGVSAIAPGFTRAIYRSGDSSVSWQAIDFHPRCTCRGFPQSP